MDFAGRNPDLKARLAPYLDDADRVDWRDPSLPVCALGAISPGLDANRRYFDHAEWAESYFRSCHRDAAFRERWLAATGVWDAKVVVDIGCGPGNVYATLGGRPRTLIGVDAAPRALRMAATLGYLPLLADAHALPLRSTFADLVAVNATLHHCDDMARVLTEAARLVAVGGVLVTDHDPQASAWHFRGLGRWMWDRRLWVYRVMGKGFHADPEEQAVALASEIHHQPGRGVSESFFREVLEPLGFEVAVHPHNHVVGANALRGARGRAQLKYRVAQRLSGISPDSMAGALSLLCRARRNTVRRGG